MASSKDTLEWMRDVSLILFGYIGFLYQIYLWSERDINTVVLYGVILFVLLIIAGLIPHLSKEKIRGGR